VSYKVGQIIYLLSKKDVKIFPAQIIEEIQRKTIDSEMISYIISLPNKDRSEVLMEEIKADIFTSLDDVEKEMTKNAKEQILSFLKRAKDMESIFKPAMIKSDNDNHADINENDVAEVDLGNGIRAKIDMNKIPV
jgi:predicted butyrate kinase (DUF1464 family)